MFERLREIVNNLAVKKLLSWRSSRRKYAKGFAKFYVFEFEEKSRWEESEESSIDAEFISFDTFNHEDSR